MSLFCSVTFFAMELFEQLGFAEAKLIVAVISASLRAIGNIFAGPIVIFKGMYYIFYISQMIDFKHIFRFFTYYKYLDDLISFGMKS